MDSRLSLYHQVNEATNLSIASRMVQNAFLMRNIQDRRNFDATMSHDIPSALRSIVRCIGEIQVESKKLERTIFQEISPDKENFSNSEKQLFALAWLFALWHLIKLTEKEYEKIFTESLEIQMRVAEALEEEWVTNLDEEQTEWFILFFLDIANPIMTNLRSLFNQILYFDEQAENIWIDPSVFRAQVVWYIARLNWLLSSAMFGNFHIENNLFKDFWKVFNHSMLEMRINFEPFNSKLNFYDLIWNLIQNSIDHAFDESIPFAKRSVNIDWRFDENWDYIITYSDNWKWMSEEQLWNVFIKWVSSKQWNQWVCMHNWQRMLRERNWDIEVLSTEWNWAIFKIKVPKSVIISQ